MKQFTYKEAYFIFEKKQKFFKKNNKKNYFS